MTWKVKQDSPYFISCLNDAFITYNTTGSFLIGEELVTIPASVDSHYQLFTTYEGSYGGIGISNVTGNFWEGPFLEFFRAEGTYASPTAVTDTATLAQISSTGVWGTDWTQKSTAGWLVFTAAENWGAGARGSKFSIYTTQIGTTSIKQRLQIDGAGDFVYYAQDTSELFRIDEDSGIVIPTETALWLNGNTTSDAVLYAKETGVAPNEKNALYLGVGANVGRNIVICDAANYGKAAYFNADDPTFIIQSASDPLVTPNEHLLLGYAAGYGGIIACPGGPLYIRADTTNHHVQIGLLGSPTHSLAGYDFFVEGDTEIDGTLYADGATVTAGKATFHSETAADGFAIKTYEGEGVHIGVGMNAAKTNGQIIICNNEYIDSSFNHGAPASDPTLLIFSGTNPASATNEWLGLLHDKTDTFFVTGKGRIILFPNTYTMAGYAGVPGHASSYTDIYVEDVLEVDGILYADGGIVVDSADSIDCTAGSLNLGGTVNVNFAGASRTASTVTHDAYVELEVAGVSYKFMLGS